MGLDICIFQPISVTNDDEYDSYTVIPEKQEEDVLYLFKEFFVKKGIEYFDLVTPLKEMGYSFDDLQWYSSEYEEFIVYKFHDTKHVLYDAFKFLENNWAGNYKDTFEELSSQPIFQEFKEKHLQALVDYGWKECYDFFASGPEKNYFNFNAAMEFAKNAIMVVLIDPPVIIKEETVMYYEEVGYQRKGANQAFYNDKMWSGEPIIDINVIKEHHKKYFSETKEDREKFQKNIIDKFIPGKHYLVYC